MNNVAALVLAIMGVVHSLRLIHEEQPGGPVPGTMPAVSSGEPDFSRPLDSGNISSGGSQWGQMVGNSGGIN